MQVAIVDHELRFVPAFQRARELLLDGAIGAVLGVESTAIMVRKSTPCSAVQRISSRRLCSCCRCSACLKAISVDARAIVSGACDCFCVAAGAVSSAYLNVCTCWAAAWGGRRLDLVERRRQRWRRPGRRWQPRHRHAPLPAGRVSALCSSARIVCRSAHAVVRAAWEGNQVHMATRFV